jgi:lysine 6-dehydrogenase
MPLTHAHRFVILGAGRQGTACAAYLLDCFDATAILLVDVSEERLAAAHELLGHGTRVTRQRMDVTRDADSTRRLFEGAACVISCVPFFLNVDLTRLAIAAGTPFTDLGGNVGTVAEQLALADECRRAGVAIVPDCGLAPGLLNILAEYWAPEWNYESVRLYCGGLPQDPRGLLKYALTFNVCGLFNEYFDDCEVSRGGRLVHVPGMSEPERLADLALPGEFEAFATSGGASLGAKLYAERGVDYQYKTIRYPGHRDIIVSMREQGFFSTEPQEFTVDGATVQVAPRELSAQIMTRTLPSDGKDLVVAHVNIVAECAGQPRRGRIDLIDFAVDRFTAMERTTGFPTAITAAALAGLYDDCRIAPGAYVPLQIIDPKLMMRELARGGVNGITVRENVGT